jgi:hypothetical protein
MKIQFLSLLFLPLYLFCQETDTTISKSKLINKVLKGDVFSFQGSITSSFRSYSSWGIDSRQTPFSSTITGNATIQSFQFSIPFSFLLNNLSNPTATTPFSGGYFKNFFKNQKDRLTRFGVSPQKGWFRAHLGDRYMSFSEFTMSNHNFRGLGVELTPGKFRFAAMGGLLANNRPRNISINQPNFQTYQRLGWGVKTGYGDSQNFIEAILFRASDIVKKDDLILTDSTSSLMPEQNLVLGFNGKKMIGSKLSLSFEFGQSALSRNVRDSIFTEGVTLPIYNSFLFKTRSSTDLRAAYKASLIWNGELFQAGFHYNRVAPGYRTLGNYFFNNDLEDFRSNISLPLMNSSLNLNGSLGFQRNNLNRENLSSFLRIIGNLNVDYRKGKWFIGGRFNNFDSRVDYTLDLNSPDSLKAIVVSRDLSLSSSYTLSKENGKSLQLNLNSGIQGVTDNLDNPNNRKNSNMYFLNLSLSALTETKWQYNLGIDFNQNRLPENKGAGSNLLSSRFGVNATLSKTIFKDKGNISFGSNSYYAVLGTENVSDLVFNHSLRNQISIGKNQQLNVQLNFMQRINKVLAKNFNELIGSLTYSIRFDGKLLKK